MQWARQRRLIVVGALAAVGVVLLVAMARATAQCRGGDGGRRWHPRRGTRAQRSVKQLQRSIRCLINLERKRELGRLARDKDLQEVGLAHSEGRSRPIASRTMRRRGGPHPAVRGRHFDARMWQFAENTGCALSAEAMVANWMATRFHRVNILERRFHEIGVGAVEGGQGSLQEGYATFVVVLGWHDGRTPRH